MADSDLNLHAFGLVSVVAMIGIGCLGFWMMFAFLRSRSVSALEAGVTLIAFAMFLFALFLILPTLFAGWSVRDPVEEEPEGRPSFLRPRRR